MEGAAWGEPGVRQGRTPWEHQTDTLQEMAAAHAAGRTGHFLWIPVGMGKTYIVLGYLCHLLRAGRLPQYVLYTLPSSAMASVLAEVQAFGFTAEILVPLKSRAAAPGGGPERLGTTPRPYTITLLEHDHLRPSLTPRPSLIPT